MIRSHFAGDASEQGDIQYAVAKGWCKVGNYLFHRFQW